MRGDLNRDGTTDFHDWHILRVAWNAQGGQSLNLDDLLKEEPQQDHSHPLPPTTTIDNGRHTDALLKSRTTTDELSWIIPGLPARLGDWSHCLDRDNRKRHALHSFAIEAMFQENALDRKSTSWSLKPAPGNFTGPART